MDPEIDKDAESGDPSAREDSLADGTYQATVDIRCPSCRKTSAIPLPPPDAFDCPRCRCELAPLARIRADAASLLVRARTHLLSGAHTQALSAASSSWDLCHSRAAASLAFVAATLDCDVPDSLAWLRASRRLETCRDPSRKS